jgi:iron complex outermembrane receptor protein
MGGAINFVTNTGEGESALKLHGNSGSYGLFKGQISSGGVHGAFDYYLSFSNTQMDGYRQHSEQDRNRLFGNFGWVLDDKTHVGLDIVYADVAEELPGALTFDEFQNDPDQADPTNVQNDWGRDYDYTRISARMLRQLNENQDFEVILFGQYRDMIHPIFQILDQDARNFGAEVRYRLRHDLFGRDNNLVVGFSPTAGSNNERRYANESGQNGALVAQFQARAANLGFYFENQIDVTPGWMLSAGGRVDFAKREFEDRFLSDGDRSDERNFSAFSPKVGILWKKTPNVQFFGNISRSYEPPLLLELTSFGAPGFLDLQAQDTWQFEIGSRGVISNRFQWDVSFYDAEIQNELINQNIRPFPFAPFTIPSYRNAENTRHLGLELGSSVRVAENAFGSAGRVILGTAYTYNRFRFVGDEDFGNNQIPGAPAHVIRAELRLEQPQGFWIAPNFDWSPSEYFVDSANTVTNDNYFVMNLKAGYQWENFLFFVEGSNLTDELYSGSVQVDNAAGRFFEPSSPRSIYAGVQWEL